MWRSDYVPRLPSDVVTYGEWYSGYSRQNGKCSLFFLYESRFWNWNCILGCILGAGDSRRKGGTECRLSSAINVSFLHGFRLLLPLICIMYTATLIWIRNMIKQWKSFQKENIEKFNRRLSYEAGVVIGRSLLSGIYAL